MIPSLCSVPHFRRAEKLSAKIPVWESTIFGQINTLISYGVVFPKKLKLSLNCYIGIYEGNLYFVSEKEKREKSKKKRRTKQGVQLDDPNCHTFTCLYLNIY